MKRSRYTEEQIIYALRRFGYLRIQVMCCDGRAGS